MGTVTHGEARVGKCTPEYIAWCAMKRRCLNPKHTRYRYYGGRGITIAPAWVESYETFLADIGRKPSPSHSLDRIDVNGDYEPTNCRWATQKVQKNNRTVRRLDQFSTRELLAELESRLPIRKPTIGYLPIERLGV
jgi:hypothetical protein